MSEVPLSCARQANDIVLGRGARGDGLAVVSAPPGEGIDGRPLLPRPGPEDRLQFIEDENRQNGEYDRRDVESIVHRVLSVSRGSAASSHRPTICGSSCTHMQRG